MIPNVFVSSTIADLQHLRDAVRETIIELGYTPIMSDYGDIGYLPTESAEKSCYVTMPECQIAILIIGKRYGCLSENNFSVTHNEFRKAKENGIPIISIVDQEVLSFKRVYDANAENSLKTNFPNMDNPILTFSFINEITDCPTNNGILPFDSATKAKQELKKQIAHFFGQLITDRFNPIKTHITDILSEIKTLRHELLKDSGNEPTKFYEAMKFLLSNDNLISEFKFFIDAFFDGVETGIPSLLSATSFMEVIELSKGKIELSEGYTDKSEIEKNLIATSSSQFGRWRIYKNKHVIMNAKAFANFENTFNKLKKITTIN